MARRAPSGSGEVTQAQLAEILPLLPALTKVMTRRSHEVPSAIRSQWHEHGLAPRHMNLLVTLALNGAMSVTDLSGRLGIGLATTSLLVGELGRVGIVVRSEDPADRRRTIVDLAPAQRQAIAGFVGRRAAVIRTALETLEPEERVALVKGLHALVNALEATSIEEPLPARQRR
jgi:DNA-binding MarR family transcriptional regulator